MNLKKYHLVIKKGETFRKSLLWKADGVPVDLTGYTARMQIRDVNNDVLIVTLNTTNGGITLGGVLGTIGLYLTDAATTSISLDSGVYDMELVSPTMDVRRLIEGSVTFLSKVTRGV